MKKSQFQKVIYCTIPFIQHYWNDKIIQIENRLVAARGYWEGWDGNYVREIRLTTEDLGSPAVRQNHCWKVASLPATFYSLRESRRCLLLLFSHSVVSNSLWPLRLCSLPGSSVQGTLQARTLERAAVSFLRASSWPRDQTFAFCIGRQIFYHWATREAHVVTSVY